MGIEVIGAVEVEEKLRNMDPKLKMFLMRRINVASELLRERIIQDLMSGVWGIQSRHGTAGLAGTVHQVPAEMSGTGVDGGVRGGAAPHQYGAMFQHGGNGPYTIQGNPVLGWKAYGIFQKTTVQAKFAFTADMIFAKRVNHPAMKKSEWMTGPLRAMAGKIAEILRPSDAQTELFT